MCVYIFVTISVSVSLGILTYKTTFTRVYFYISPSYVSVHLTSTKKSSCFSIETILNVKQILRVLCEIYKSFFIPFSQCILLTFTSTRLPLYYLPSDAIKLLMSHFHQNRYSPYQLIAYTFTDLHIYQKSFSIFFWKIQQIHF